MVHCSASHRHVVVLMSEPEHGYSRKGQMREDAGVQPHQWQVRGNVAAETCRYPPNNNQINGIYVLLLYF